MVKSLMDSFKYVAKRREPSGVFVGILASPQRNPEKFPKRRRKKFGDARFKSEAEVFERKRLRSLKIWEKIS
jgi:hypothetical protein